MKIFMGYDPRDHMAFQVAEQSIRNHATCPVDVIPVTDWGLRRKGLYWREYRVDRNGQMWDDRDGKPFSTQFSFTRFAVPALNDYRDEWVLFMDPDMMFRGDIAALEDVDRTGRAVMCVQHDHTPKEDVKMDGVLQTRYLRKNWSSFMYMNTAKCRSLTPFQVNNATGAALHAFTWTMDDLIGELPKTWNFLAGYDDPAECDPLNVHFTLGTPDMDHAPATPWDAEWWAVTDKGGLRHAAA